MSSPMASPACAGATGASHGRRGRPGDPALEGWGDRTDGRLDGEAQPRSWSHCPPLAGRSAWGQPAGEPEAVAQAGRQPAPVAVRAGDGLTIGVTEDRAVDFRWGSAVEAEERAARLRRAREAAAEVAFPDAGGNRRVHWGSAPKLVCPEGHRKEAGPDGVLRCRECRNEAAARYRAKQPPKVGRTVCKNGHDLSVHRYYEPNGHPRCAACVASRKRPPTEAERAYQREWGRRKRASEGKPSRLKRRTYA